LYGGHIGDAATLLYDIFRKNIVSEFDVAMIEGPRFNS
jgi:hypothetical protein